MTKIPPGPEQPILMERFVGLFRLPYPIGCVIVSLLGVFLNTAETYFSLGLSEALTRLTSSGYVIGFSFAVIALYAPHYMRGTLLHAEKSILHLLPNGEADFHRIFKRLGDTKLQLILITLGSVNQSFNSINQQASPVSGALLTFIIVNATFFSLVFTSLILTYVFSLWGLLRIGAFELRLVPYYKDRFLGLRPIGSLALSFAVTYFAVLGLTLIAPPLILGLFSLQIVLGDALIVVIGILMFFLPLMKLHQRMLRQKSLEREKLSEALTRIFEKAPDEESRAETNEMILETLRVDMMKREINSMATWPFDFQILGRLIIIILAVSASLLTRLILIVFGQIP